MSRQVVVVRCFGAVGLIGALVLVAHCITVLGIRRCYFPNEPVGDLLAVILPASGLVLYFAACTWSGRLPWIMRNPGKDSQ